MRASTHPSTFSVQENFPNARRIRIWEGGCAYLAERDGIPHLVIDEGSMADFIDEDDCDLLSGLVKVIAFGSEFERMSYVRNAWPAGEQ